MWKVAQWDERRYIILWDLHTVIWRERKGDW